MLGKGAKFVGVLVVVSILVLLALQPLMPLLQGVTATATSLILNILGIQATATGSLVEFAGLAAEILPVCIGDFEIAILVGAIAATADRKLGDRIAGVIAGTGFVLAVNPLRIAATLAAWDWLGVGVVEVIHSVLFRVTIVIVIVGFYGAWYLREGIIRRARKFL